jgi:hypothetical protein
MIVYKGFGYFPNKRKAQAVPELFLLFVSL